MRGLTLIIFFLLSVSLSAQTEKKFIREGNKLYKDGKYGEAENSYRSATSKKSDSYEAAYNTANSLYKQGKYEAAASLYDTLSKWKTNDSRKAKLFYNLGNSLVKTKKLNEGINAYKNSLKIDPKDEDTKYNLSYAYKLLKQQQDQQKQQNKDKKNNKDKKDDKNKKDQDKKDNKQDKKNDQNKDNKDKKDQQNQQDQNNNNDQKKKPGKEGAQPQISQEAAQQMLEAIQNDEKNVQKKLQEQKKQGQKVQVQKNW